MPSLTVVSALFDIWLSGGTQFTIPHARAIENGIAGREDREMRQQTERTAYSGHTEFQAS